MATAGPGYTAVPSVTMVTAGVSMVTPPAVTGGCYVQSPPPPALHAAYFTNNYSTELPYQVKTVIYTRVFQNTTEQGAKILGFALETHP